MRVFAVDSGLCEYRELDAAVCDELLDFFVRFRLLSAEFVGGEREDLETLRVVLLVKGDELLVVSFG